MKRVIFATDRLRLDISPAEEHGEIVYLLTGNNQPSPFRPEDVADAFNSRLDELEFDPDRDFIALSGPAFLTSMLLAVVCAWCECRVNVLLFDATAARYVCRPFTATQPTYIPHKKRHA